MSNLLIFGTGAVADILIKEYLDLNNNKIVAFLNTRKGNTPPPPQLNNDIPVCRSFDEISKINYDFIMLASGQFDTMYEECIKHTIPKDKIIGIIPDLSTIKITVQKQVNFDINRIFNLDNKFFKKEIPNFCINTLHLGNELWLNKELKIFENYEKIDIQRSTMLKAVAHEILKRNIVGNVAELGVYQGDFSKIINELFPDRLLYLFDTFDGFVQKDLIGEQKLTHANVSMFKDTTVNLVLSKMVNKNNCKIIKGYFPESAAEIEDSFALVSIDADLYKPIYEGLVYFYKRLTRGGYILIHDFNNTYFSGARKAVEKFCEEMNIGYVPISDYAGSVIITK